MTTDATMETSTTSPSGLDRWAAARDILLSAAAVGLVAGLLEAGIHVVRFWWFGQYTWTSGQIGWMAPLSYLAFLGSGAVPAAALAALRPRWPVVAWFVAVASASAAFALVRIGSAQRLHLIAMAAIAVGVGTQLGRRVYRAPVAWSSLARRTVLAGSLAVVALAAIGLGLPAWRERSGIAGLPAADRDAPNVLLLVLDTVRGESLSLYGYSRPTTPRLSGFANRGVVFDRAISAAPWTLPSHATMFTGRQPWELGASFRSQLDGRYPTLAERFRERGYLTAGFVANTIYASEETGLQRGFLRYQDYRITVKQILLSSEFGQLVSSTRSKLAIRAADMATAPVINDRLLSWLPEARRSGRPFFAFLNFMDAHLPYRTPDPWEAKFRRGDPMVDRYDAAVGFLDDQVGRLIDELDRQGVLDNTIVVVTADHGEHVGDHKMDNHANSLYLQLLRVPLVVVFPKSVPAGRRVVEPAGLIDLPATLLELAGATDSAVGGRSLRRFWTADSANPVQPPFIVSQVDQHPIRRSWYRNRDGPLWGALGEGHHLIENPDRSIELYDYLADPGEVTNLSADSTRRVWATRLRAVLDSARAGR